MMRHTLLLLLVSMACAFLVVAAGCAPFGKGTQKESKFYVLNSLTESGGDTQMPAAGHTVNIGVGPVRLPKRLDRPQILSRTGGNEVEFAEFHRWAEPLRDNFLRVLAENLTFLLSTDRVALFPWRSAMPIDCQVLVEVLRFEGQPGGSVTLYARWMIVGGDGQELLWNRTSSYREPVEAHDYGSLVSAMSKTVADLSRDIAAAINHMPKGASHQ